MRRLQVLYSGNINRVGTRKYLVYEFDNNVRKTVATIYSNEISVKKIAEDYANAMGEEEVILEYDEKDDDKRILIKEAD